MNTRLQVEHPVTELITGVDLVEQMIRVAAGEPLSITQDDVKLTGWAIENRLYAEDPYRGFLPSIGRLTRYRPPAEVAAGPLLVNGKWQGDAPEGATAVRNDTGVYEGGEISMYYDPMIAKLCTWAPTRAQAIEAMRIALDSFEVEGIGHNLPFLSAVMDHPKFISGDMTTAFIAEEYPDGFEGVTLPEDDLRRVAASAAAMHRVAEIRRARVSGRMDNHERVVSTDWVVALQGESFPVHIDADHDGSTVTFPDGEVLRVASDWTPGDQLAVLDVNGSPLVLKVGKITQGFRLRTRGADLAVKVRSPRQAELAALMPEKVAPDTSKLLLCPMPGLIVKVNVEVGQEVQEGQALCTVEAMKMENILRAEKKGIVSKINAAAGDSLAVDDVIMEFE
jgi:propionyl-CoA carboxylase alpha chain